MGSKRKEAKANEKSINISGKQTYAMEDLRENARAASARMATASRKSDQNIESERKALNIIGLRV